MRALAGVVEAVQLRADPPDHRLHRAPARLGRVCGQHGMHPQVAEQCLQRPGGQPVDRPGEGVPPRVARRPGPDRADPLPLLGEVDEQEVGGERAGDLLRPRQVERGRDPRGLLRVALAVPRGDHRPAQPLHVGEQVRAAALGEHLPEGVAQQAHVAAQLGWHLGDGSAAPGRLRSGPHAGERSEDRTLRHMAAEPTDAAQAPDPHTTAGRLAELHHRTYEAVHAGSEKAVEKQHARGKKTARERIEALLDPGSFVELDALARHRSHDFGQEGNRPYGDGVVTGWGTIDGREVCIFSQDVTIFGGSLGEVYGEKIVKVMDLALKTGRPVVGINEGGGARIQEGVVALGLYAEIFYRNTMASGVVPQISLIMGPCAGGHVYSPAITDFTLMVDQTSYMFITGPDVIKTVTGEDVTFEELGGARTHNEKSGVAHFMASDEDDCFDLTRALLAYLPSNNMETAPAYEPVDLDTLEPDTDLDTFMPDSANVPYDMHQVIARIVDDGEFLEVHAGFARNMICGFARVDGQSVGVVANQPMHYAGTLDIDASDKAARFVRTCDAFNVPVLTFVDVPGFLPGTEQEYAGIIRHGAKLIFAYSEATVPKVTVITRKAYGGAYDVMGSKHLRADVNLAWPSAEIAVMGAQGAVNILYRRELASAEDADALRQQLITEYGDTLLNPYVAAERGYVDAVIPPSETRREIVRALRLLRSKRESLPPKKHGNIPL